MPRVRNQKRGSSAAEESRQRSEAQRQSAESARGEAEKRRSQAESRRDEAEELRAIAESVRGSSEAARAAAEEARRHRDAILVLAERLRRDAEQARKAAEEIRKMAAGRFDTETRRAIREEVEISAEMQRSAEALRDRPASPGDEGPPAARQATRFSAPASRSRAKRRRSR